MAKKPISRVRRKKGAALFAVISIMALLIAMASTAYFTARSSYNSVISNYSYSQLYLSAISVSDMVTEAVINDSTAAATASSGSADPDKNYFDSLRNSVLAMNTVGQTMSAYTDNISSATADESTIINELRNGGNPAVPGVIDGVVVNIELTSDGTGHPTRGPVPENDGKNSQWYWFEYAYTFTTTAYYRNSAITVEDVIVTEKARLYTPDDPDPGPGGGGTPGYSYDITNPGGNNGSFSTFFTATGQELKDGKIERTKRTVKIKTHEISDDAFFQNSSTYFVNGNNNKFVGGVTSTGSVYLEKFTTDIKGDKNDWWIGQDLVMTNNNANNLNLTKDNNLYVGNDLVIAANGNITAKDIYVEGDLYIMGQATFNANLHVSGNIYYEMPLTKTDENGNVITTAAGTAAADGVNLGYTRYDNYSNGWSVNGTLDINGKVEVPAPKSQWDPDYAKLTVNGTQVTIPTGTSASTGTNGIGTYDPASVNIEYSNRLPNYETDKFEDVSSTNSVAGAIQSQVGSNVEYYNYTSPQSAYKNELDIDFTKLAPVEQTNADGTKTILYYEYSDTDTGLHIVTETPDLNGNVSVTIPYKKDGYMIDIDAASIDSMLGPNVNITYNLETSNDPTATAMPVVLKNNILVDSDGDGAEDDPGFSWQGNNYNSNDNSDGTKVVAVGSGNVVLEMANIDKNGNYVPYDPNKYNEYQTVTYVAGQKEVVGNEAQCNHIGGSGNLKDKYAAMLQSGTSTPKDEYQNQIMLVSNQNGGIAFDAKRQNNAFCGYIYAPNGELANYDPNGADWGESTPVFGGMIVSTYNAQLSNLIYAEPKPSIISNMLGSLNLWSPGGNGDGTTTTVTVPEIPGTPPTPPPPPGPGDWGDPQNTDIWNFKGSNFVG